MFYELECEYFFAFCAEGYKGSFMRLLIDPVLVADVQWDGRQVGILKDTVLAYLKDL